MTTIYGVEVVLVEGVDYERDVVPAIAKLPLSKRANTDVLIQYLRDELGLVVRRGRNLNTSTIERETRT